jgi:hypothetical protein
MTNQTWRMGKALSELMDRHGVELQAPQAVPLSPPTETPMWLSGMASTLDVDIERVQFAAHAFEWADDLLLKFDHTDQVAGHIEQLGYTPRGELTIAVYADHEMARRCNAFSVSGDVLQYSLHDTGSPNFFARVERCRLREISLVPAPVNARARVLRRELPSPASRYAAGTLKQFDLLIRGVGLIQKEIGLLKGVNHA